MSQKQLSCGRDLHAVPNLTDCVESAGQCGYVYAVIMVMEHKH